MNKSIPSIFPTLDVAISVLSHHFTGDPNHYPRQWKYQDENGEILQYVFRWDLPTGKIVRPVRDHPAGWQLGAIPPPRPLYQLLEIASSTANEPVFVAEGEPAADVLRICGLLGTTSFGGASAPHKTDWSPLCGKHVVILPDNDLAGRQYALTVARLCHEVGAASVKILDLLHFAPQLGEGDDIVDIYRADNWGGLPLGDAAEPADLGNFLRKIAAHLTPWTPDSSKPHSLPPNPPPKPLLPWLRPLIRDCLDAFRDNEDKLPAKTLAQRITDPPPWITRHGKPLSPARLGKLLKRCGLTPHKTKTANVYYRDDFKKLLRLP